MSRQRESGAEHVGGSFEVELAQSTLRLPLPEGWRNESVLCFIAPPNEQRAGMLVKQKTSALRASYSVVWEEADADLDIEALQAHAPPPAKVVGLKTSVESHQPPVLRRTFRYTDPLSGAVLQQEQTLIAVAEHLYTVTLTAEPLHFAEHRKDIAQSPRSFPPTERSATSG